MECSSQISVSGSWITTSEKLEKSLQVGKCMAEYCLLTLSLSLIII